MKKYKRETGAKELQPGFWLTKDRKKNTAVWNKANTYNLKSYKGYKKYKSVSERRDFYLWFDQARRLKGKSVEWAGYAAIVSGQIAKLENHFLRIAVVHNKEIIAFAEEGSYRVFDFAFPLLKEIYFSRINLTADQSSQWDLMLGEIEQCEIIEPLYLQLSKKNLKKLNRMAQGKGIYSLGVKKAIRFEGDISVSKNRVNHMYSKLQPYYRENIAN